MIKGDIKFEGLMVFDQNGAKHFYPACEEVKKDISKYLNFLYMKKDIMVKPDGESTKGTGI